MRTPGIERRPARRLAIRIPVSLLLLLLLTVLYLAAFGFPDRLARWLVEKVDTREFALEAGSVKLDLLHGLRVHDVALYRNGRIGPAAAEARELVVTLNALACLTRRSWLKEIAIREGLFRPQLAFATEAARPRGRAFSRPFRTHLVLEHCDFAGLPVRSFACDLLGEGTELRLENIRAEVGGEEESGAFTGRVTHHTDSLIQEGQLESRVRTSVLVPFLTEMHATGLAEVFRRFEFPQAPPACEIRFRRRGGPDRSLHVEAVCRLPDCRYRGVDVVLADGRVTVDVAGTNRVVTVDPLLVVREEGVARGGFTVDLGRRTVDFDGVSTIDPIALFGMIGILSDSLGRDFRFEGPVRLTASGTAGMGDFRRTRFEGQAFGRDVGVRWIEFEACAFEMTQVGRTNTISDLRCRTYGGELEGSMQFVLPDPAGPETNTLYRFDGRVRDADFARLSRKLEAGDETGYRGLLSFVLTLSGRSGPEALRALSGNGALRIRRGHVFRIPVFGGLSDFLTELIPGLNFVLSQTDVRADFTIGAGRIHTENLGIEGDVLSLKAEGDYYFDRRLDFHAQVTLMKKNVLVGKLLRLVTYPISKLFEFRVRGTVSEPEWYAVNFSRDLLKKLGVTGRGVRLLPAEEESGRQGGE